jgi:hypothetical protein
MMPNSGVYVASQRLRHPVLPHSHFCFGPIHAGGQSMAQENKTPRAGTIFRARGRALSGILFNAFTFTGAVVSLSMIVFLLDSTSEQVNTLLTSQNVAALKLWNNVDYYERHKPSDTDDPPLPPGLVNDLVEFSRTNANIKKVAHRLAFFAYLRERQCTRRNGVPQKPR